ncbi:L-ascorbate metabolism protein UlaG, beta-lactamase superfamily [Chitinophaga terrae (ex Kim and Jung 2007)]|uniref:L-ascorbate metabolism protein UlaG, beta-lactamase superfamily n=1 Tax=Chitinophaga terrae (ex Kim and Jung 2007) TaxID=408074 RepID=A0A1H4G969_9BACT|nr:MBL fold metallo-hydrolase [Chitinophaga terrae (ex Kim and Jung 2007)]GEP93171.1 hypothetical protein CTE07_48160 [Chitinophaga terrae (ex Kim and Jung 2007)]SEB06166.1 L-ascorbate metabolism protein UlaG, beta-lactamase superfamily [Chitinophaga terrae (ex Kim and Jung 2007)]
MKVQRLGWAGIKITAHQQTILIDAVEHFDRGKFLLDTPDASYKFSDNTKADIVLITHLHKDHYDAELIRKVLKPGGKFIVSDEIAGDIKADGFNDFTSLQLNETFSVNNITITPVFAMDGTGDKQVSWVIEDGTHRILHGGDTIWHNQFWAIGRQYNSFDAVFLPVNGATMYFLKPFSPIPATLTPIQAVSAAHLVNASTLVPIHYGFNKTGLYEEFPDVVPTLKKEAAAQNVMLKLLQAGESIEWN